MLCPSCRTYNRARAAFCVDCGTMLTRRSRRRFIPGWLLRPLLLLGILLAASAALAFSPLGQRLGAVGQLLSRLGGGERTAVTRETVVLGIQSMSQLATAKYTIQTVVEVEQRGALGPLTSDRILLRANADVLAGIELGAITAANVQTSGEVATITLPAPKLVSKDITYQVYDRKRGWFASANKDLQSAAEAQARAEIVATACQKGILKEAQANAESALRAFLLNLGFKQVTFIATPPDAGACAA